MGARRCFSRFGLAVAVALLFGGLGGIALAQDEEMPKKPAKGKTTSPKEGKDGKDDAKPGKDEKPSADQKLLDKLKRDIERAFAKGKKDTVWIVALGEVVYVKLTLGDDGKQPGYNRPNAPAPYEGFAGYESKKAVAYEDRDKAIDDIVKYMTEFPQTGKVKKVKGKKGAGPDSIPPHREWAIIKVLSGKKEAAYKDQALETYNAQFKAKNATPPQP